MLGRTFVRTSSNWYKMQRDMSERNLSWRENLKDDKVGAFLLVCYRRKNNLH
jgi:hypothetical protein